MAEQDVTVRRETAPAGRQGMRGSENFIRPPVDIFETGENLVLMADLPGVDKEHLDVNLEGGILTIRGTVEMPMRGEPLYREFAPGNYFRQFDLPEEIDAERVSAELKNGVLHLTMPKSESAKPRRIEIKH
jgi:HSP20 family molecular chaperone IbpA